MTLGVHYDVIVVGGGPAGSSVATRLAQQGRRVALFEKERFPRFHIGESLLPCSMPLFEKLGVLPALERAGFLAKHAAEFITADGSITRRYPFAEGLVPGFPSAFEVDRAEFDQVLLEHAKEQGVLVHEESAVTGFRSDVTRGVEVAVRGPDGATRSEHAEILVDASGQSALVSGRLGLREFDPSLKNFAVFSHFEGAGRAGGEREGDISVVLVPDGWFWVIPLRGDRTSVGLVGPARGLNGQKPDESFLMERIERAPYLAERLRGARRVAPVRTVSDWSYVSRALAGDRFLIVGDAGAFIDPVFSTGVYLGMLGAFDAASSIDRALTAGRFERRFFSSYERRMLETVATYRAFVRGFYTPEFAELLLHPSDTLNLRRAITSLLAGHGVASFPVKARVLVFRALARLNRSFEIAPRVIERRGGIA